MTESIQFLSSVQHIMNTSAPVISADETISDARAVIEANGGNPVAIVGPNGDFEGILSPESQSLNGPVPAGQLARSARMIVAPHESAFSVVSRMLARRIDWVPVLSQGKIVGSISRAGVMSAFGESHTA